MTTDDFANLMETDDIIGAITLQLSDRRSVVVKDVTRTKKSSNQKMCLPWSQG